LPVIGKFCHRNGVDIAELRQQPPLPETADELCEAATKLGVPDSDVWLGERMTESAIKNLSVTGHLKDYRSLHFATHGLVSGDLNQNEPALVFSPPAEVSDVDDGLLTASEVMQLKLNADLVVMSACNTAAGNAPSAEALSGLAQAFFYAGARTLLVSHWPVDSQSAVFLTTRAFETVAADPNGGYADAMRRSMMALIEDKSRPENAHPAYWAPFAVVGGGR
jgi:CHAT domain-containing protein